MKYTNGSWGLGHAVLTWLCDGYWPSPARQEESLDRIRRAQDRYIPVGLFATGAVTDVVCATAIEDEAPVLLKISRIAGGNSHLENERNVLARLRQAAGTTTYAKYLPNLVDTYSTGDRASVNVFRLDRGFCTLEQVHEQHPALDGRHLAWIFKRLLLVLGFCHRQKIIHGAVSPDHVLLDAASHGLKLIGWGQSVIEGQRFRAACTRYRDWYPGEVQNRQCASPTSDLFLAARCLVYLAGGDPVTNRMPDTVPVPMQRFFNTCLLESAGMRPDDAWALHEDFDELLQRLYGPPKFHELTLN